MLESCARAVATEIPRLFAAASRPSPLMISAASPASAVVRPKRTFKSWASRRRLISGSAIVTMATGTRNPSQGIPASGFLVRSGVTTSPRAGRCGPRRTSSSPPSGPCSRPTARATGADQPLQCVSAVGGGETSSLEDKPVAGLEHHSRRSVDEKHICVRRRPESAPWRKPSNRSGIATHAHD